MWVKEVETDDDVTTTMSFTPSQRTHLICGSLVHQSHAHGDLEGESKFSVVKVPIGSLLDPSDPIGDCVGVQMQNSPGFNQ